MWGTVREWNNVSRSVKKGEKCQLRAPDGAALFSGSQTKPYRADKYIPHEDNCISDSRQSHCNNGEGYEYEGSMEESLGGDFF